MRDFMIVIEVELKLQLCLTNEDTAYFKLEGVLSPDLTILIKAYAYKTEGNCPQNGGHRLPLCLYQLALLPSGVGSISPHLESRLVFCLAFPQRIGGSDTMPA